MYRTYSLNIFKRMYSLIFLSYLVQVIIIIAVLYELPFIIMTFAEYYVNTITYFIIIRSQYKRVLNLKEINFSYSHVLILMLPVVLLYARYKFFLLRNTNSHRIKFEKCSSMVWTSVESRNLLCRLFQIACSVID